MFTLLNLLDFDLVIFSSCNLLKSLGFLVCLFSLTVHHPRQFSYFIYLFLSLLIYALPIKKIARCAKEINYFLLERLTITARSSKGRIFSTWGNEISIKSVLLDFSIIVLVNSDPNELNGHTASLFSGSSKYSLFLLHFRKMFS